MKQLLSICLLLCFTTSLYAQSTTIQLGRLNKIFASRERVIELYCNEKRQCQFFYRNGKGKLITNRKVKHSSSPIFQLGPYEKKRIEEELKKIVFPYKPEFWSLANQIEYPGDIVFALLTGFTFGLFPLAYALGKFSFGLADIVKAPIYLPVAKYQFNKDIELKKKVEDFLDEFSLSDESLRPIEFDRRRKIRLAWNRLYKLTEFFICTETGYYSACRKFQREKKAFLPDS